MAAIHPEIRTGFERLLPGWRAERAETLGGSDLSVVQRLAVLDEKLQRTSIVAKLFTGPGDGPVRESAALASLPPGLPVPRLLAEQARPPLLLLSDAGTGPSVADALLGRDPAVAAQAVFDWADAIARLHAATLGTSEAFSAELARRDCGTPVLAEPMTSVLADQAVSLASRAELTGLPMPDGMRDELAELAQRLADPAASALSPDDACPDNNVRDEHGALILVDFEGAAFRHVAWDVSYLTVPWPTCWCCWRLPDDVATEAIEGYRAAVRPVLPWADGDGFQQAVDRPPSPGPSSPPHGSLPVHLMATRQWPKATPPRGAAHSSCTASRSRSRVPPPTACRTPPPPSPNGMRPSSAGGDQLSCP
jgi:hypothetical protein